jgi:hypothetical protein
MVDHKELLDMEFEVDQNLKSLIEDFEYVDVSFMSLQSLDAKIKELEFRENISLSDGTFVFEGYFDRRTDAMSHFCRF